MKLDKEELSILRIALDDFLETYEETFKDEVVETAKDLRIKVTKSNDDDDDTEEEEEYKHELDEHGLIDSIEVLYDNGLGSPKIHDLMRLVFLKDGDLARQMCKELLYWIENETTNKSNV